MNTPKTDNSKKQWAISGLSRSALMRRAAVPNKDESKLPSSTPKLKFTISKISDKNVITKKKLEFAAAKHLDDEKEEQKVNYDLLDDKKLEELIEERKKELAILKRHQSEKEELTNLIEKWKEVSNDTIEEVAKNLRMDTEELIEKMQIPKEFLE